MASDALFLALANAKSQPDKWARALGSAGQAGESILGGYLGGKQMLAQSQEAALKPYEIWSKISDSAGPDVANNIFKQRGIPVPDMSSSGGATPDYTADQLMKMGGSFATKQLGKIKTNQDIQNTAPVDFGQVRDYFASAGKPEIGESLIKSAQASGRQNIQKDIFDKASGLVGPRSDIADALNRRTDLQVANAINHNVNGMIAGTGALGQSGKNNLRIARVSRLLQRDAPLTPEEMNLVKLDMTAIAQGGVPDARTAEEQGINTVATKFADLVKQLGNNPATFNDAGFRQRAVNLGNEMIAADNGVQEKAFNMVKANYGHLTTPEHLERIHQAIINNEQLPIVDVQGGGTPGGELPGGSTGDPEADAAIKQIMSSTQPEGKKQAGITAIRQRIGS